MSRYISFVVGSETEYINVNDISFVDRDTSTSTIIYKPNARGATVEGLYTITHTADTAGDDSVATAIMNATINICSNEYKSVTIPVVLPTGVTVSSITVG